MALLANDRPLSRADDLSAPATNVQALDLPDESAPVITVQPVVFYFEHGFRLLRNHPLLSWSVIAAALMGAVAAVWPPAPFGRFARQIVPVGLSIAVIPMAVRFCYDRIVAWHATLPRFLRTSRASFDAWLALERRLATDHRMPSVAGALLLLVAAFSFPSMTAGLAPPQRWVAVGTMAVGTFMAGVALYYVAAFGRVISALGKFDVTVEAHQTGVRSVGGLMAICWSSAAIIWGAFSSTAVGNRYVRLALPTCLDARWPVFWLSFLTGTLIALSFVVCQLPLHRKMVDYKRAELERVEAILGHLLGRLDKLSDHEMTQVKFLETRTRTVAKLPEWPFDWAAFLWVSALSISFLFPQLLEKLVNSKHAQEALRALVR